MIPGELPLAIARFLGGCPETATNQVPSGLTDPDSTRSGMTLELLAKLLGNPDM